MSDPRSRTHRGSRTGNYGRTGHKPPYQNRHCTRCGRRINDQRGSICWQCHKCERKQKAADTLALYDNGEISLSPDDLARLEGET